MALDSEVQAAGYALPGGNDDISLGDDAIKKNAHAAYEQVKALEQKLPTVIAARTSGLLSSDDASRIYATKEELGNSTLSDFSGGPLDLGEPTARKMVGYLISGPGTIAGVDVLPGEVWVFVGNGTDWQAYKAGGGAAASTALGRPVLSVSGISDTAARVSWAPLASAERYEARLNGGLIQEVTSPWNITGLSMVTDYSVDIRAVAGESSGPWATATFKTLETPPTPLELATNETNGTVQIKTTTGANDTTYSTAATYGKFAFTKKALLSTGFVEFTANTPPGAVRYGVGLNGGSALTGGPERIGVYIETNGQIMLTGGTYAGGVDSKSNISAGTRIRLGRSQDSLYIEQKQAGKWVRLGAQAAPSPLASTKLGIFGPPNASWDVQSVAGSGWV